jgi:hypothetical protein
MAKTSEKLSHLGRAVENSKDLAGTKAARNRDIRAKAMRGIQMQHQIDTYGTDPQVVEEVSAGTVPDETPEDLAGRMRDESFQLQDRPDLEIDVKRLRTLYVTSTISWQDFKTKYIASGAAAIDVIRLRERWDDQRVEFHNQRIEAVADRFHEEMEDALQEHNQMHLEISMLIGKKIREVLPSVTKPVEIQSCAVALKNIQAVSRLALGASTDNTALKGVDDFEEFLKGVKSGKKQDDQE